VKSRAKNSWDYYSNIDPAFDDPELLFGGRCDEVTAKIINQEIILGETKSTLTEDVDNA
jgi:hypothetical protein